MWEGLLPLTPFDLHVDPSVRRFGLTISANEIIDWRQPSRKPVLTRIAASGADLVYMGGVIETGAQTIVQQMREAGLVAPRVRFMGPDGLFVEELLTTTTCDAALATEMRVTFPGLPTERLKGTGARTYDDYEKTFGKEPTAFALYAAEAGARRRPRRDPARRCRARARPHRLGQAGVARQGHRRDAELRRRRRHVELRRQRRRR